MKKTSYLISIIMLTSTISACSNINRTPSRSEVYPNNTNGLNQNTNTTNYKDGTFIGESNGIYNSRQLAYVTVSGGKISDITLKTVDSNGKEIGSPLSSNNTANGTGFNGSTAGTGSTGVNNSTARTGSTGTNTSTVGTGLTGANTPTAGTNTPTAGTGLTGTNNSTAGTGLTGTNTPTAGTESTGYMNSISTVGYKLVTQVVQNQAANVNVQHNLTGNDLTTLNHYKEAIQRALDKARM